MRTFVTVFFALFLAELGDKTQLAVLGFSTESSSRWVVFVAASLALIASTGAAVLVGDALTRVVPAEWLRVGAATLFIVIGVVLLIGALPEVMAR
ncbi:MAG TPA: TMEM165/GDT1 family protein [Acidimicrobiia bacterium]|nr:TMEM165/GDT1 family protein [Acidimicrobiia bacterium]